MKVLILDSDQFEIEELLKNKDVEYPMASNFITMRKKGDEELNKVVVIFHR
jgi:hypothetical protein